ncbi:hypothetical protein BGX38DRAFT_161442 [Terfezia claveryi]|nr:hypothetical protein BGX38DRAFT_161442 [Terfezia claveryi]
MGNPNADASPALSASKPATSDAPSDLPSSSGPCKPTLPTNLLDVDPDTSPHLDEPLPSYEHSTSLPASSPTTVPSSDPPPFSIYQPTTHPHYLNNHLVTHDPHLNTDGEALYQFLLQENLIPPIQHVQVRGSHQVRNTVWETDREGRSKAKTETRTVEDFRFRLDLTGGLWPVMQARGEAEGLSEGGILKVLGDEEKVYRGGGRRVGGGRRRGNVRGKIQMGIGGSVVAARDAREKESNVGMEINPLPPLILPRRRWGGY